VAGSFATCNPANIPLLGEKGDSLGPHHHRPSNSAGFRRSFAAKLDEDFSPKVQLLANQVYAWVNMMESKLSCSARYERDHFGALSNR